MATAITLISSVTVGSGGAANIEFTSIPATYTDLLVNFSPRSTASGASVGARISFNSSTSDFTGRYLSGSGSATESASVARYLGEMSAATGTASTFSNISIYIPNYASSNNKSFSVDGVQENNTTAAYATLAAGLWSNSAAITTITLTASSGNLAQYSTAYLYGISNA